MLANAVKLAACALPMLLAGCGHAPPVRTMTCADALPPQIMVSGDGERRTARLTVLTYNIEGLSWPARSGRGKFLREIGERLEAMHGTGAAPDVVMFQEMFSNSAKRAVEASGYPAIASGPRRVTRARDVTTEPLPGKAKAKRGEIGLRFLGSGLAIASRYPIREVKTHAFGRRSCAGIDCLANKGVMLARIAIPGVPVPVDLYNTHMNARGASRAPAPRNLAAHDRQALEASEFVKRTTNPVSPLVFGGDFNMRHSEARWENFSRYQSLALVHRVCAAEDSPCDVRMSWDGDAPWMDTQDLQFFWPGDRVSIRPVRVESMFDGRPDSPVLSDHDGFLVTYELRWAASLAPGAVCAGSSDQASRPISAGKKPS